MSEGHEGLYTEAQMQEERKIANAMYADAREQSRKLEAAEGRVKQLEDALRIGAWGQIWNSIANLRTSAPEHREHIDALKQRVEVEIDRARAALNASGGTSPRG